MPKKIDSEVLVLERKFDVNHDLDTQFSANRRKVRLMPSLTVRSFAIACLLSGLAALVTTATLRTRAGRTFRKLRQVEPSHGPLVPEGEQRESSNVAHNSEIEHTSVLCIN